MRIGERSEQSLPPLEDVRDTVRREWANTRHLQALAKFYEELLKRYTVTTERPEPVATKSAASE